jgi:hypothetical protein
MLRVISHPLNQKSIARERRFKYASTTGCPRTDEGCVNSQKANFSIVEHGSDLI